MKLIITGDLRDALDSYNREEISYSRMVEILNEKANKRLKVINSSQCCIGEAEQVLCSCDNPNGFKEIKCNHNRRTQNFSDVFGYYETCLDCGNDLNNKIESNENSKDFKFIYGFITGVVICIIAEIINQLTK